MHEIPQTKKKETKIKHIEVAELRKPIMKILGMIHQDIENGKYGIIIGDDASGRIPAIILGEVIKEVAKSKGVIPPDTIFIPGKRNPNIPQFQETLKTFLQKYNYIEGKRVLIVTDTIQTGGSLSGLVKGLVGLGTDFEIATIGIEEEDNPSFAKQREDNLNKSRVFSGDYTSTDENVDFIYARTPTIWKNKLMSGVDKPDSIDSLEGSRRLKTRAKSELGEKLFQDQINESRKDARILISELIEWYKEQYEK